MPVKVQRELMLALQVDLSGGVRPCAMLKPKDVVLGFRRVGTAVVGVGHLARLRPRRPGENNRDRERADQRHAIGGPENHIYPLGLALLC